MNKDHYGTTYISMLFNQKCGVTGVTMLLYSAGYRFLVTPLVYIGVTHVTEVI